MTDPYDPETIDVSTPEKLIDYMSATKDEADWNRRCDAIKKSLGGGYPEFWYPTMISSGVMDEILGAGASELKMFALSPDGKWERYR